VGYSSWWENISYCSDFCCLSSWVWEIREYQMKPGANVEILCGVVESFTWWLNGKLHPVSSSNSNRAIFCFSRIRPLGIAGMVTCYQPELLISLLWWRITALLLTQRAIGDGIRTVGSDIVLFLKHQLAFTHVLKQCSKVLSPVLHSILKSVKPGM